MRLDDLLTRGPHGAYLFGFLDETRKLNPDWLICLVGAENGDQYIWIRQGPRGSRTTILPLLKGKERFAAQALRRSLAVAS